MALVSVYTTAPDAGVAEALDRGLVERRLAICVNIIPGAISIYRWKGKVFRDAEVVCYIKADGKQLTKVMAFLEEHHPYDTPAIYATSVTRTTRGVLDWVRGEAVSPACQRRRPAVQP